MKRGSGGGSILDFITKKPKPAETKQQQQRGKLTLIVKNILEADEAYILQQCNCYTIRSHGLSATLAKAYAPWGDAYASRRQLGTRNLAIESDRDTPGTVRILSSHDKTKHIVCAFAQLCPGKPLRYRTYPKYQTDTREARVVWFQLSLQDLIEKVPDLDLPILKDFAETHNVNVRLYKLPLH